MKKLVFGSLNIDRTYQVPHFVLPGETLMSEKMELFCGGKGFNQAIAFARAGEKMSFAGAVGADGDLLVQGLEQDGISLEYLCRVNGASGHAVIQVDPQGQNCIIILRGANGEISKEYIDETLSHFGAGDFIMLQNEISNIDYLITQAKSRGMIVGFNPSPWNEKALDCDYSLVDYLLVNEVEGVAVAGSNQPDEILTMIHSRYPNMNVLLTLGSSGSIYMDRTGKRTVGTIHKVDAVDTTAAGDTFTGYFLSELLNGSSPERSLAIAAIASGISVSRKGASASIPYRDEVEKVYQQKASC